MRQYEPAHLRTDVLVFTQIVHEEHKGAVKVLEALGCTRSWRNDWNEPSMCRLYDYVPLKFRNPHESTVAFDLKGYGYGEVHAHSTAELASRSCYMHGSSSGC